MRIWPLLHEDAEAIGLMAHDLRSRGRSVSLADVILAVVALRMGATLLTTDRDFEALPEVPAENRLAGGPGGEA